MPRALPERSERRAELGREQVRLFPGREVTAPVDLVVVSEGGICLLDPAARGRDDLTGERGESDRNGDRRGSLARGATRGLSALPVGAGSRGPGRGQPVRRDVVEDVVSGEIARRLPVDKGAGDLVVAV